MTKKEREQVKATLKELYIVVARLQKEKPNDQAAIDRALDLINIARTLLQL